MVSPFKFREFKDNGLEEYLPGSTRLTKLICTENPMPKQSAITYHFCIKDEGPGVCKTSISSIYPKLSFVDQVHGSKVYLV